MTVVSPIHRNDYAGTGSTGPFAYTFRIFRAEDLAALVTDADGTTTTLAYPSGYTVTGAGERAGGSVTTTAAVPVGSTLTLVRALAIEQPEGLRNQGAYFPENIEDALDRSVMIDQQQQDDLDRAFKLPVSTTPGSVSTEIASFLPSYYLRVKSDGSGIEGVTDVIASQSFLQSGTGAVTRTMQTKAAEAFSVTDFGAVGNGVTDVTTKIQAAITALSAAGGGSLFFPPGTYHTTGQILLASNVTLTGVKGQSWIGTDCSGQHAFAGDLIADFGATGLGVIGLHACAFAVSRPTRPTFRDCDLSGGTTLDGGGLGGGIWLGRATDMTILNNYCHGNGTAGTTPTTPRGFDIQIGGDGNASVGLLSGGNVCTSTAVQFNYMCFSTSNARHIALETCSGAKTGAVVPITKPFGEANGYNFGHYGDVPGASHNISIVALDLQDSGGIGCYLRTVGNVTVGQVNGKNLCQTQNDGGLGVAGLVITDPFGPVTVGHVAIDTCGKAALSLAANAVSDWSQVVVQNVTGTNITGRPVVEIRGPVNGATIRSITGQTVPWVIRCVDTIARAGLKIADVGGKNITTAGIELLNVSTSKLSDVKFDTVARSAVLVHAGGSGNTLSDIVVDAGDTSASGDAVVYCDTDASTVRDAIVRGSPAVAFQVSGANSYATRLNGLGSPTPLVLGTTTRVKDCPGYNPVGPTTSTAGTSPYTYPPSGAKFNAPATLYIMGGVVSGVSKNGTPVSTATGVAIHLEPLEQVVITHTGAPTLIADVH